MSNKLVRWMTNFNYPSYWIFFVTAICNMRCKMCFYEDNMAASKKTDINLSVDEYDKITRNIKRINILGISGGEPFIRDDLSEIIKVAYRNCSPLVTDSPTNGYYIDSVVRQVEDIVKNCPNMIYDLQISIDGPEEIHNKIRGLKNAFSRLKETYKGVISLKRKYKNLRVKVCVVYSAYNQHHIEELFSVLNRDFKDLDRVVFSVAHGSVPREEAMQFDWDHYFKLCDQIRDSATVKNVKDFHSIFTLALRMAKNDFLKRILKVKNYYKVCGAGKKVVVLSETGKVFPCEPLWSSVGGLRDNDYDVARILASEEMNKFQKKIIDEKCNCHWGLPMSNALIQNPRYYPKIMKEMIRIMGRSMRLTKTP